MWSFWRSVYPFSAPWFSYEIDINMLCVVMYIHTRGSRNCKIKQFSKNHVNQKDWNSMSRQNLSGDIINGSKKKTTNTTKKETDKK